jgi:quercetin dioxygenase-like cupin family protein
MDDVRTEVLVNTPQLRAERFTAEGGAGLPWQRCQIAERVLVVTQGRGYCYRAYGRDETRDEVSDGDVVRIGKMIWHRVVAAPDQSLTATLVTSVPADVELRR